MNTPKITLAQFAKYDNYVFDLDGTLYYDGVVIKNANHLFNKLLKLKKTVLVMTNNSASDPITYALRLQKIGFNCKPEMVVNSTTATIAFLEEKYPKKSVFIVGTNKMFDQLKRAKINLTDNKPEIVLVGNDQELTTSKLVKACRFLKDGAIFLATNPDLALPLRDHYYTCDCGAICQMLTATVNKKPFYIGKPNRSMLGFIKKGKTIIIGDRLYTDIQLAINCKFDSLLVLSGETTFSDLKMTETKPTYYISAIGKLFRD